MRRARLLATHHRGVYAALRRPCLARDAVYSLMQPDFHRSLTRPLTRSLQKHRSTAAVL